ncbi:6-hydroxymethylpterin diphosphokinase MptE-like protein [Desulfohalovibrio reitneri]|uniref:6-hydroxymethylpterin diphosphokinase MptE-like protein n=1 Tax=Desulfohalovibrio reitneri TaxID=1307759 RepID=UPI0004A6D5C7|nr:6-hydroxymethylpterin diphosphokinase MptE-like protein [Desulfohalovibrio reitneri]
MIRTSIGSLEKYDGRSLVLALGPVAAEEISEGAVRVPSFSPEELEAARATPVERFRHGVHFLLAQGAWEENPEAVREMQAWAVSVHYKYFHLPAASEDLPDPQGVRENTPFNILHHLRLAENVPLHLLHPLADKLSGAGEGKPALLLLPGPSLKEIGPHLAELKKHCLLVTISRCLPMCHQHGAMPDFLVQLDCTSQQGLFFPEYLDLSGTTLVALSVAPVAEVAHRFAGVFFMESFSPDILPNPFRLRESWLSSLMPCMGLAETLGCSPVVLTGSDLCFPVEGEVYYSGALRAPKPKQGRCQAPLLDDSCHHIQLDDRHGQPKRTTFHYLATAGEVETVMREITETQGVSFRVLEGGGILSADLAPDVSGRELLDMPTLDRTGLEAGLAEADRGEESLHPLRLKMSLLKQLESLTSQRRLVEGIPQEGAVEWIDRHPFLKSLAKAGGSKRVPFMDKPQVLGALREMLDRWENRLRLGLAWTALAMSLGKGQDIHLLALREERRAWAERIAGELAGARVRILVLADGGGTDADDEVPYNDLFRWLQARTALAATPEAMAAVRRVIPWKDFPQIVPFAELARLYRARPPAGRA